MNTVHQRARNDLLLNTGRSRILMVDDDASLPSEHAVAYLQSLVPHALGTDEQGQATGSPAARGMA